MAITVVNTSNTIKNGQFSSISGSGFQNSGSLVIVQGVLSQPQLIHSWSDSEVKFTSNTTPFAYGSVTIELTNSLGTESTSTLHVPTELKTFTTASGVSPPPGSNSVIDGASPPVAAGDQIEFDLVTNQGAAITMNSDGTYILSTSSGIHTFSVRVFDISNPSWSNQITVGSTPNVYSAIPLLIQGNTVTRGIRVNTTASASLLPPVFVVSTSSAAFPFTGGTIQYTAIDPEGVSVIYSLPATRTGITIDSVTGLVTVNSLAANTDDFITVRASDGVLFSDVTTFVDVGASTSTSTILQSNLIFSYDPSDPTSYPGSGTTVFDGASVLAFSPNRPHVGTGYIGVSTWGNSANWARLARCSNLHFTHFNGAEAQAGRTLRSAIEGIKALAPASMGCNPMHAVYIVHDEVPKVDGSTQRLRDKLDAEKWYLYASGTSGSPVDSSFGPSYFAINRTSAAASSGGENWVQWYASLVYVQNVTGEPGNSANPSLDAMFLDNCYWQPRINADFDRDGVLDNFDSAAYRLATREGVEEHFEFMRSIWPAARAQLGNVSDWHLSEGPALYNETYTPNYANLTPLVDVIDGGLAGEYFLTNGSEPFSVEWQERNNGLTGFYAARNQLRFIDGAVRNPRLNMWSVRDVLNDGSAADNQRRRFGAAFISVCSDGCIDDRWVATYTTLPLIYTNGTGVGWLGQPKETPRYTGNSEGVYIREFDNGFVAVNPRNNGSRSFILPVATRDVESGATYAANAPISIADRDGVFLVKT